MAPFPFPCIAKSLPVIACIGYGSLTAFLPAAVVGVTGDDEDLATAQDSYAGCGYISIALLDGDRYPAHLVQLCPVHAASICRCILTDAALGPR